jgi:hypothetical protein
MRRVDLDGDVRHLLDRWEMLADVGGNVAESDRAGEPPVADRSGR